MKKITFAVTLLSVGVLIGASCQKQEEKKPEQGSVLPPVVTELQNQTTPEIEKEKKDDRVEVVETTSTTFYRGYYFDVEYPSDFTSSPSILTTVDDAMAYHQTDEAHFLSPDESVEFFVFSPLWAGESTYLKTAVTEEMVDEKIEESDSKYGKRIVRWVTLTAKDNSYYRSFVSIKEQRTDGSELHHIFGIKYKDSESYQLYKEAYLSFKESLRQYAD